MNSSYVESTQPSEKPDAIIELDDRRIGIEHTRIFQPDTPDGLKIKREEEMRDRVVLESEKRFKHLSDDDIYVQISFNSFYWLN